MRGFTALILFFVVGGLLSLAAHAEAQDPSIAKALKAAQAALQSPQKRKEVTSQDPQAKAAEKQVEMLGGTPEDQQVVFDLAAEIMGDLVKQSNGDVEKMQALLNDAVKNPEAFANRLTPEQKRRIHDLSTKLPAGQGSQGPAKQ